VTYYHVTVNGQPLCVCTADFRHLGPCEYGTAEEAIEIAAACREIGPVADVSVIAGPCPKYGGE